MCVRDTCMLLKMKNGHVKLHFFYVIFSYVKPQFTQIITLAINFILIGHETYTTIVTRAWTRVIKLVGTNNNDSQNENFFYLHEQKFFIF